MNVDDIADAIGGAHNNLAGFVRLDQRMTETGVVGVGLRCRSKHDDPSTPSGITRCLLDHGHTGDHIHVNANRTMEWP